MHPICHDCQQGITGYFQTQPVACHCPADLEFAMARLSRQLLKVADTLDTMTVAKSNEIERQTIDAYRLALQDEYDRREVEWRWMQAK